MELQAPTKPRRRQQRRETIAMLDVIAERVAAQHGLKLAILIGRSQIRKVANARSEFYAEAYSAGYSSTQIGRYAGGRDHTTILHSLRTMGLP